MWALYLNNNAIIAINVMIILDRECPVLLRAMVLKEIITQPAMIIISVVFSLIHCLYLEVLLELKINQMVSHDQNILNK